MFSQTQKLSIGMGLPFNVNGNRRQMPWQVGVWGSCISCFCARVLSPKPGEQAFAPFDTSTKRVGTRNLRAVSMCVC